MSPEKNTNNDSAIFLYLRFRSFSNNCFSSLDLIGWRRALWFGLLYRSDIWGGLLGQFDGHTCLIWTFSNLDVDDVDVTWVRMWELPLWDFEWLASLAGRDLLSSYSINQGRVRQVARLLHFALSQEAASSRCTSDFEHMRRCSNSITEVSVSTAAST